jgi:hypothetical protein
MLGLSKSGIVKRVKDSAYLQEVIHLCVEERLDDAEKALGTLVRKNDLGAICFFLKTIGKRRGYAEIKEVNVTTTNASETMKRIEGNSAEFVHE